MCGEDDADTKLYKIKEGFVIIEEWAKNESYGGMFHISFIDKKEANSIFPDYETRKAKKLPIWCKKEPIVISPLNFLDELEKTLEDSLDDTYCDMDIPKNSDELFLDFIEKTKKNFKKRLTEGE